MSGTLILVPGLNCTRRLFEPQIEALLRSRTVLVADNTKDESISAMASRLLAGAPDRFALAGLSMGGYVALDVLRQAPGRVEALALLDTTARPDTESSRDSRERLIALAESGRFEQVHSLLWPRLVAPARLRDRSLEGYRSRHDARHRARGVRPAGAGHHSLHRDDGALGYTFRVLVPAESGYPYAQGASKTTRVLVNP